MKSVRCTAGGASLAPVPATSATMNKPVLPMSSLSLKLPTADRSN